MSKREHGSRHGDQMWVRCAEFDRLQELNTEAAKRIRHFLEVDGNAFYDSQKSLMARRDLEDIAERIEKGLGPPLV